MREDGYCNNCGMHHDPIQVTIHGEYGHGPMPVEFRDALVEMVRLVTRGIDDGTLGRRASAPRAAAEGEGRDG